jgi:hypothetical protein
VKRLIVLLIVLAGGLAAAAFSVPSNAASVNGASISQNTVNTDLMAIAHSSDYQCFLNAEELVGTQGQSGLPPIDGVGQPTGSDARPTVTASFASNYVDTLIGHQLVLELAAQEHLRVDAADLTSAHTQMVGQMTAILQDVAGSQYACSAGTTSLTAADVLGTMPASFVKRTVQFDATVDVFEDHQAGVGSSAAGLESYFNAHASTFDTACFTVAEYSSQAAAQAAVAEVTSGTPFAQVATQATGGGPQGCDILYGIASSLPAGSNLESQPVGTVSSPISISTSEYLLIQITKRTPTSFAQAEPEVRAAAESAGSDKARSVISAAEKKAAIALDGRYGEWTAAKAQVIPPVSPLAVDVLNTAVNGPGPTKATSPATSTGQTP